MTLQPSLVTPGAAAPALTRIEVSDGSRWPRPAMEADPEYGIGHRLRYAPLDQITREDLLAAAAVIDAYGYLLVT